MPLFNVYKKSRLANDYVQEVYLSTLVQVALYVIQLFSAYANEHHYRRIMHVLPFESFALQVSL